MVRASDGRYSQHHGAVVSICTYLSGKDEFKRQFFVGPVRAKIEDSIVFSVGHLTLQSIPGD